MSKKIMVVSASPHKVSNSEILASEFIKGAKENGNICEEIKLRDLKYNFCNGCLICAKTLNCVQKDDVNKELIEKMRTCDIIVFATPVYYYAISGQLKTFIDRLNPLYCSDFKFKEVYLIATAAENLDRTFKGVKEDIKGFVNCYQGTKLKGTLFVGGLDNGGDVKKKIKALKDAYELGLKVK